MINTEDILAQLAQGKTPEDIAKEMTDALNKAQAEYDKKQANTQKRMDMAAIIDAAVHYLMTYYPDAKLTAEIDLSSPEKIDDMIDGGVKAVDDMVELYNKLDVLASQIGKLSDLTFPLHQAPTAKIKDTDSNVKSAPRPTKKVNAQLSFDPDKVIADFISKLSD